MPTVRKGSRQVSTMALPGVRLTSAETPESRGAGLAIAKGRTTEAIGELAGTVGTLAYHEYGRMQQEERQKADQVALIAASNKLDNWELQTLYDPQKGALQRKGSDSFTLPEDVDQDFEKVSSEIEQGLGNADQKLAFAKMKAQRGGNVRMTVARHVAGQRQAFDANENQATVKNKSSLAIANALDPRRAAQELDAGVTAIKEYGQRNGFGPEAISEQVNAFRSDTHIGIISNLLANEQTKAAQIYFEETKHDISGDKLDDVTRALHVGNTREEAQQETARILAMGDTFDEQRAEAKKIKKADVQDDVLARLEHEKGIKQAQARQTEEDNLNSAYNTIAKTGSVDKIDPALLSKLGAHRPGLESYARSLSQDKPIQTNWEVYYRLKEQASQDPQGFLDQSLLAHRYELGESEFKQLTDLRSSLWSGKGDEELPGFRTRKQIADDTLSQYGLNPNARAGTAEAKAIAQFYRMLDTRVDAAQQPDEGGKRHKVSTQEIQDEADDLLSQSTTVPGSWWNIWPGGKSFTDVTKRLIDITPADIPVAARADLEKALRAKHRPVSDQTVLDLYLEMQVR